MTFWPVLLLVSACDPAMALEGKRFFAEGKFGDAEERFRLALEQPCGESGRLAGRINLAAALRERNALAEAREVLRAAGPIENIPFEWQIRYWNCFALLEEQSGRFREAEAAYGRAMALITPSATPRLALEVRTNWAKLLMRTGRLEEAAAEMEAARALPGWLHERPAAYDLNLAALRRLQGHPREAESILRELLARGGRVAPQMRGAIANNLATLTAARDEFREAEALWGEANRAFREAYGPAHPIVAKGLNNLAAHYVRRKRYAQAETLYREALAIGDDPLVLNNLGTLLHGRKRLEEAEELYRRAARIYELRRRPHRDAIPLHGNLAGLLAATGRIEEARAEYDAMIRLLPQAVPADEPAAARYLAEYEALLRRQRESAGAERVAAMAMRYRVRSALRSAY